ncbi:MAG TPA: calcium-binding protein [Stellaceae bacterium]|jgi:hypothetical protein|nr:calcium-binding protein [Stellaceae bacterium]
MASIAGSQFVATAATAVNVGITSDGTSLPPPVGGEFNLEVWTGGGTPTLAPGYQGLLVDYNGQYADLVTGAFALTDSSSGGHYIQVDGVNETVTGAPGDVIVTNADSVTAIGDGNVILGYGDHSTFNLATGNNTLFAPTGDNDTITTGTGNNFVFVEGANEKINLGSGNDTVFAYTSSTGDTITASSGNDLIYSLASNVTINGGSGNDTIAMVASNDSFLGGAGGVYTAQVIGNNDTFNGGASHGTVLVSGNSDSITAGSGGADTITVFGNTNTVSGGASPGAQIAVYGNTNNVLEGTANNAVTVNGSGNTVTAGSATGTNQDTVNFTGSTDSFVDGGKLFNDTVIGFDHASGDTIHLTSPDTVSTAVVTGSDTLLTLSDSSTILLKGVTNYSGGFLS